MAKLLKWVQSRESWGSLCRGCPTTEAEVGTDWVGPRDLFAEGTLAGELKLKLAWARVVLRFSMLRVPGRTSETSGCKCRSYSTLHAGRTLVVWLNLR